MMPKQEKKENPSRREPRRNVKTMSKLRTGVNEMPSEMEICEPRMGS